MKMQKSPWYKNPYWLGGIALGVVVIALVLFLALRGGGDKKPDTPDQPNIEEPTPPLRQSRSLLRSRNRSLTRSLRPPRAAIPRANRLTAYGTWCW